jgi:hypothetical protein
MMDTISFVTESLDTTKSQVERKFFTVYDVF